MALDALERMIFATAAAFLETRADEIERHMAERKSCELPLNHLFARAFRDHHLICVREAPYLDLGAGEAAEQDRVDLLVLTPDKRREIVIEAKQVHDNTGTAWRDRLANGGSIAADLQKLSLVPQSAGRSRLVMCYMTALLPGWDATDWRQWLGRSPSMPGLTWERVVDGPSPLFALPGGGWFDILVHKIEG